jgi:hypothetical protein
MGAEARHTLKYAVCDYTVIHPMPMPLLMSPPRRRPAAGGAPRPLRRVGWRTQAEAKSTVGCLMMALRQDRRAPFSDAGHRRALRSGVLKRRG